MEAWRKKSCQHIKSERKLFRAWERVFKVKICSKRKKEVTAVTEDRGRAKRKMFLSWSFVLKIDEAWECWTWTNSGKAQRGVTCGLHKHPEGKSRCLGADRWWFLRRFLHCGEREAEPGLQRLERLAIESGELSKFHTRLLSIWRNGLWDCLLRKQRWKDGPLWRETAWNVVLQCGRTLWSECTENLPGRSWYLWVHMWPTHLGYVVFSQQHLDPLL